MAVRVSKKKSPPVLSHEFIRKNHGDIACIAFLLLFGGSMLQLTSKYMNPLSRFSYTFKSGDESMPMLYGNGNWDFVVVFTYSLFCVVLTCVINENVSDKFIPRLQLSLKKAFQLRYTITYSLFYLFTTVMFVLMLNNALQNDDNFSIQSYLISLVERHPEEFVSFYVKLFYTIALSFCVAMLMNIYFWGMKPKNYMSVIFDSVSSFLIYYAMQYLNCGTLGVYLIVTFTIPKLFWALKYVADEFVGKKSYPMLLAFSLVHMVTATVGLTLSWIFTSYLIRNSKITSYSSKAIATSAAFVIFTAISSTITLSNLKDTFGVVFKSSTPTKKPTNASSPKKTRQQPPRKINESKTALASKKKTLKSTATR